MAGLLLLELPATIFAYSGFFARLTTAFDMVLLGVYSTAIGCLCWLVGRAMGYVLERFPKRLNRGIPMARRI